MTLGRPGKLLAFALINVAVSSTGLDYLNVLFYSNSLSRESTYSDHHTRLFRACSWTKWVLPAEHNEQFIFKKCFGNVLVPCGFGQGCVFLGVGKCPILIGLGVIFFLEEIPCVPYPRANNASKLNGNPRFFFVFFFNAPRRKAAGLCSRAGGFRRP